MRIGLLGVGARQEGADGVFAEAGRGLPGVSGGKGNLRFLFLANGARNATPVYCADPPRDRRHHPGSVLPASLSTDLKVHVSRMP